MCLAIGVHRPGAKSCILPGTLSSGGLRHPVPDLVSILLGRLTDRPFGPISGNATMDQAKAGLTRYLGGLVECLRSELERVVSFPIVSGQWEGRLGRCLGFFGEEGKVIELGLGSPAFDDYKRLAEDLIDRVKCLDDGAFTQECVAAVDSG